MLQTHSDINFDGQTNMNLHNASPVAGATDTTSSSAPSSAPEIHHAMQQLFETLMIGIEFQGPQSVNGFFDQINHVDDDNDDDDDVDDDDNDDDDDQTDGGY